MTFQRVLGEANNLGSDTKFTASCWLLDGNSGDDTNESQLPVDGEDLKKNADLICRRKPQAQPQLHKPHT